MAQDNVALLEMAGEDDDGEEETMFSAAGTARTVEITNRRRTKSGQGKMVRIVAIFIILTIVITLAYILMTGFLEEDNTSLTFSDMEIPGLNNIETTTSVYQNKTLTESERKEKEKQKIVLFWTNYFSDKWKSHFGDFGGETLPGSDDPSSSASCLFTTDRSKLSESSAVVFHGRNFDFNDLPKTRKHSQRWVFYLMESPYNSGFDDNKWIAATKLGFNWTMTYTTKSDVSCPYCHIDEIQLLPNRTNEESVMREIRNRTQNWAQNFTNRSRDALWFVSNCGAVSKRNQLVDQLEQNGILVDSFGGCSGKRPDPIIDQIGPEAFYSQYKFYLALENSLCDDYVSWIFYWNPKCLFLFFPRLPKNLAELLI